MAVIAAEGVRPRASATSSSRTWSWPEYFALIGVPILFWEVWTLVAWLTDDPHTITTYSTPGSGNAWACRIIEVAVWAVALVVAVYVIRGVKRERRLTFDAAFCLAGMLIFWADCNADLLNPLLLFSSNLVNLNSPMGHMPFVINPTVGAQPDPILLLIPVESFDLLGAAIVICAVARRTRARHPEWSTAKLVGLIVVGSFVVELLVEGTMVAFGVWTYTSPAPASLPFGRGLRLPFPEIVAGAIFFLGPALLRYFRNDRGETLVERGLSRRGPIVRGSLLFLALYAFTELITWGPSVWPDWGVAFYQTEWPKLPNYLVNDICNAPGVTDSRFGPCPGSPGYELPGPFTPNTPHG